MELTSYSCVFMCIASSIHVLLQKSNDYKTENLSSWRFDVLLCRFPDNTKDSTKSSPEYLRCSLES